MSGLESRVPEPELMEDPEQARAYAEADFSDSNRLFVDLFGRVCPERDLQGCLLDLGCGPADIPLRLARGYPGLRIDALDGSQAMLEHAREAVEAQGLGARVELILGCLPTARLPRRRYEAVASNSLLHHLGEPAVLWDAVRAHAEPGAPILIMDLRRPADEATLRGLVETYAGDAPAVLRRDFEASLRAAYRPEELEPQLCVAGLRHLKVGIVSDRHLAVSGRF